jgi:hypothetical protein
VHAQHRGAGRACALRLSFLDEHLQTKSLEHVPPELSELIQHEMHHLDGVLFTDRMFPQLGVIDRELRLHRVCKALLENKETISAVQFLETPAPDCIDANFEMLPYDES